MTDHGAAAAAAQANADLEAKAQAHKLYMDADAVHYQLLMYCERLVLLFVAVAAEWKGAL